MALPALPAPRLGFGLDELGVPPRATPRPPNTHTDRTGKDKLAAEEEKMRAEIQAKAAAANAAKEEQNRSV